MPGGGWFRKTAYRNPLPDVTDVLAVVGGDRAYGVTRTC